ncbi:hypothetical protein SAMN05216223_11172 [Actinacidiphila yanglinensis]|uniref:Uncharacterized protein n=1 Tax=Actinacidiphila yanglinensis TaxID=310779 RepID=A0A1H6D1T4_9ACTN|nr:hypothetical protein [Actinacidiphila yanglinensis]SEG78883.1 hypothetical protein SAMN05216223_11172 [Actinacidiphila yanglinensis]
MPRPTNAQVAYGSLTVVLFTLAVLLLADVRSAGAVVAVAALGLVLGLFVAAVVSPGVRKAAATARPAPTVPAAVPRARVGTPVQRAEARVGEHSLR